jgi:hypothetical protein
MMKKYFLYTIFLILSFVASTIISPLEAEAAKIIYVEGTVQMQPAAQKAWKKAEKGMQINIGDSLRTASRSKADIMLDEEKKNTLRIEQKTLIVLNSNVPGLINRIDLSNGKIYFNIESIKSGLAFEVKTPSSVAGVKGTGGSVDSIRERDEVAAFKDEVYVRTYDAQQNLISEITVPEGFKTMIERFEAAGAVTTLSVEETQRWNETRQELSQRVEETTKAREEGAKPKEEPPKKEAPPEEMVKEIQNQQEVIENVSKEVKETKEQVEERTTEANIQEQRSNIEEQRYH